MIVAYIILGFSTFAWNYNHTDPQCETIGNHPPICFNEPTRSMGSVLGGIVWPIYWTGKFFLAVIK